MRDSLISLTITEVCKKLKIPFTSKNKEYIEATKTARELACIYRDLRGIAGRLETIERQHRIDGLAELLKDDIKMLESIDNHIFKISKKMVKKE